MEVIIQKPFIAHQNTTYIPKGVCITTKPILKAKQDIQKATNAPQSYLMIASSQVIYTSPLPPPPRHALLYTLMHIHFLALRRLATERHTHTTTPSLHNTNNTKSKGDSPSKP